MNSSLYTNSDLLKYWTLVRGTAKTVLTETDIMSLVFMLFVMMLFPLVLMPFTGLIV